LKGRPARRGRPFACCAAVCVALCASSVAAQDASSAVYVRTDSDRTTVISPRLRVGAPVGDSTRVDVAYSVDVWTSASVDIRASASKPITEQRDEIDASATQDFDDAKVTAAYRFSTEPDYVSNGGSIGASFDFAEHAATLAISGSASFDDVGRAGDPGFSRHLQTLGGRLSFTQLLDPKMLVQVMYEVSSQDGYLSSPYRFVAIGNMFSGGVAEARCPANGTSYSCRPEHNPDERLRHALALRLRRALSTEIAAGLNYRFYLDDWGVLSHTVQAELGWVPDSNTTLSLRYRFYTQGAATQYAASFNSTTRAVDFFTSDKELSPFVSHRIGLDVEHEWVLDEQHHTLLGALSIGPTFYMYSDFPPLTSINALEVTLALVFRR
jgi:hypothetical protein